MISCADTREQLAAFAYLIITTRSTLWAARQMPQVDAHMRVCGLCQEHFNLEVYRLTHPKAENEGQE